MPEIKLGIDHVFTVVRIEQDQYVIQRDKVTLPLKKDDATTPLKQGEKVAVFVYMNQQKRLAATMKKPKIDLYRADLVEVVEVKHGLGVFVDIGLDKDMLVSRDDLPVMKKQWPHIGDHLFCYLKTGRNQMTARLVSRFKMLDYFTPETALETGEKVEAYVFNLTEEGLVLYTTEGHELFVYYKHARKEHRLGETLEVTVTIKKDDFHYNATLIEQKEIMIDDDAARILAYLETLDDGMTPLHDKSSPEAIFEALHMSKAAFKRALGSLYKAGYVRLDKDQTVLIKKD